MTSRMSMNTSLKNARIFDDDSWDSEEFEGLKTPDKSEKYIERKLPEQKRSLTLFEQRQLAKFNREEHQEKVDISNIKTEIKVEESSEEEIEINCQDDLKLESTSEENSPDKWSEVKVEADVNFYSEDTNPSPFSKEAFKNFGIRTPQPKEAFSCEIKSESRKSAKRKIYVRESPYKRESASEILSGEKHHSKLFSKNVRLEDLEEMGNHENFLDSARLREGNTKEKPAKIRKTDFEMESDPATLTRRQKQIDFGKNTIGYDNYIKKIPKHARCREDARTPDKFRKYSRRAWDGLIKQWRLKLHKYDPEGAPPPKE